MIDQATGLHGNPSDGNVFGYDNLIFNSGDATGALIATAGTYSYAAGGSGATNAFCNATAAFKETTNTTCIASLASLGVGCN